MNSVLGYLGGHFIRFLQESGRVAMLFGQTVVFIFRPPFDVREPLSQMEEIGVRSIPVVVITAAFTGMVLALQSFTGFRRFHAETLVGTVVALSVTRELGPVLTGLMVSGRIGSAMAAELGTMRVTEQIDALHTLATNPVKYLIVPRFLASLIMFPILVLLFGAISLTTTITTVPPQSSGCGERNYVFRSTDQPIIWLQRIDSVNQQGRGVRQLAGLFGRGR